MRPQTIKYEHKERAEWRREILYDARKLITVELSDELLPFTNFPMSPPVGFPANSLLDAPTKRIDFMTLCENKITESERILTKSLICQYIHHQYEILNVRIDELIDKIRYNPLKKRVKFHIVHKDEPTSSVNWIFFELDIRHRIYIIIDSQQYPEIVAWIDEIGPELFWKRPSNNKIVIRCLINNNPEIESNIFVFEELSHVLFPIVIDSIKELSERCNVEFTGVADETIDMYYDWFESPGAPIMEHWALL